MAWRWKAPDGRESYVFGTQKAAIEDAVRHATGRAAKGQMLTADAVQTDRLWASLVRAGWRLTEG